jgi:hypothetical protein
VQVPRQQVLLTKKEPPIWRLKGSFKLSAGYGSYWVSST